MNLFETIINEKDLSDEDKKLLMQRIRGLQHEILMKIRKEAEKIIDTELQNLFPLPVIEPEKIENIIDNDKEWLKNDYEIESAWDASILIQCLIDAGEKPDSSFIRDSTKDIMETNRTSTGLWHSKWNEKDNIFDISFAVIALIESDDESKSETIQKALDFIEESVHPFGGWCTIPEAAKDDNESKDGHLEVGATSWAIIALLKGGVDPSSKIITEAVEWLKNNQNKDGGWGRWCNDDPENTSLITRTYDATCALLEAGEYPKSKLIQRSVNWLINMQLLVNERNKNDQIWGWGWEQFTSGKIEMTDIENTATAVLTLLYGDINPSHPVVESGINWLIKRKSTSGQWFGKDTPRFIMCLNEYLRQIKKAQ